MVLSRTVPATARLLHRSTRRRVAEVGTLGLAGLLAGRAVATAAAEATPIASPAAGQLSLLFVQDCESGSLTSKPGVPGSYTLTLQHGLGRTAFFSDRPQRLSGALPTADFLAHASIASQNPPNAALVMQVSELDVEVAVIELRQAHYDAITHTLTYAATLLTDYAREGMNFSKPPLTDQSLPATFGAASLFIDHFPINPGKYIVNQGIYIIG